MEKGHLKFIKSVFNPNKMVPYTIISFIPAAITHIIIDFQIIEIDILFQTRKRFWVAFGIQTFFHSVCGCQCRVEHHCTSNSLQETSSPSTDLRLASFYPRLHFKLKRMVFYLLFCLLYVR